MHRNKLLGAIALIAALVPAAAYAQSNNILVVATCGSATLQAGPNRIGVITVDVTGQLCIGGGGGGSVTQGTSPWVVSGTVAATQSGAWTVAATQSGTWTVQPGNTANTTAWLVTGTGGTFPATQSGTWTVQPGNTQNTTPWLTASAPSGAVVVAITPVVTAAAASNLVLKASAGNLYSIYGTNETATPGFLLVLNATTAPADGAVAPIECVALPANGSASVVLNPGPPARFSTGMVAVLSSGANCFTKTTGTITGFIKGMVQ